MSPSKVHYMNPSQVFSITPSEMHSIHPTETYSIGPSQPHSMSPSQVHSIIPTEAHSYHPSHAHSMSPTEAHLLHSSQAHSMSPTQVHWSTQCIVLKFLWQIPPMLPHWMDVGFSFFDVLRPAMIPSDLPSDLPSNIPSEPPDELSISPSHLHSSIPTYSALPSSQPTSIDEVEMRDSRWWQGRTRRT